MMIRFAAIWTFLTLASAVAAPAGGWTLSDWVIKDEANEIDAGDLDLCNVFWRSEGTAGRIKLTTRTPIEIGTGIRITFQDATGTVTVLNRGAAAAAWQIERGVCEVVVPAAANVTAIRVELVDAAGIVADQGFVDLRNRGALDNDVGNCAFVHHGNQGLTYTDVFRGTGANDGFDEVLELHDALQTPGNFHMSGTLITAAEWYDPAFNQWLRDGITEGWAGMLTSAYAQHIMPFAHDNMNNWAVNVEHDLVQTIYGYDTRVAWIPERVWLAQGHYPDAGLVDPWLGDNWTQHGVDAVILDDWPHVAGHNDRKIHWMNNGAGITLRVIPIDGEFTGNCHYNPGAAIAQISTTGRYGIVVYGTDWEAAAEMADFDCPNCLENYSQVVTWVHDNYPAVGSWKLDAALDQPDFNGWGIEVGNGTYGLIGGTQGYGGTNNSWYTHWAGTASHWDFHAPAWNYGFTWWNAYQALNGAPSNNLSESGWYVLMTNLHETAWHDYMGGPISGWIHRYSSHIKNANVYAQAAHWAAGEYTIPVNAYFSDPDQDGVSELVIHNDRVLAVFDPIGGRAPWIFARGPEGYNYSVVGSDNMYWNESEGDYDEPSSNNHQAAFAEVDPHYRNDPYDLFIDEVTDSTATIRLTHGGVTKTIRVAAGQPYLDVRYDVGPRNCYLRHGYTPDLVDLIWNADMQRVWSPEAAYMGFRNPHTGATGACVLGNGGAAHQLEFQGTLLRGDELRGYDRFGFLFYAGATSGPDSSGRIVELEALRHLNLDRFGPRLESPAAFVNPTTVEVTFSEAVDAASAQDPANWSLSGFGGSYTVTAALRLSDWRRVRLTVSPALAPGEEGAVVAGAVTDLNGNAVESGFNTATLTVPTGFTPHTIVIDGVKDFDIANECLFAGTDTLVITWDSTALSLGYYPRDLSTADLNINIDVNQQAGSGAATGSRGRERFLDPFRIEYQVCIEGGVGGIELNRWTGSSWQIRTYGQHTATSYNGWSSNPYTEVRIPWAELGNPAGIALNVNVLSETGSNTVRAFPTTNPIGNLATLAQMYRLYVPYIAAPMPLMGARPRFALTGDLATVSDVVIQETGGVRTLSWTGVNEAADYVIYRAESASGPFTAIGQSATTQFQDSAPLSGPRYFYLVQARSGI